MCVCVCVYYAKTDKSFTNLDIYHGNILIGDGSIEIVIDAMNTSTILSTMYATQSY